jgi:plastocyanin
MVPRFTKVLVLLVVVGLVSAGCSKKKDTTTAASESGGGTITIAGQSANDHGEKTVSGGSLDVELDDFYFNPTTIKGPAGSQVTLNLKNESGTKHNFTLADQNVNQDLDPHQDVTVTVTMPASGSLQFHCEYHEGSGMIGQLEAA